MVRLKLRYHVKCKTLENKSQFHYGSIKTYQWFKNKDNFTGSQFHYGSIKTAVNTGFYARSNYARLNSTMVRLKQYDQSLIYAKRDLSQFHYGSIKTSKYYL